MNNIVEFKSALNVVFHPSQWCDTSPIFRGFVTAMLKGPNSASHPYYVQLKIVSEPMGALHSHQDGILLLRAEAHGQPVGSGARPLVGGPGERDESPPFPKDVRGPSWERKRKDRQQSEAWMRNFSEL